MIRQIYAEPAQFAAENNALQTALPYSDNTACLGEAVQIGRKSAPNRLACQAMEGCDGAADGSPDELTVRRYQRLAEGGAGIIWFEATAISHESRANPRQLWMTEANLDSFRRLADEVRERCFKANGYVPLIILQATHSGRYSKPDGKPAPIIAYHNPLFDTPITKQLLSPA